MVNLSKLKIGGSLVIAGDLYRGKLVGVTFEPAKSNFKKLVEQYKKDHHKIALTLVPEPDNKFDPNAIAVHANGSKIGYIPKEVNTKLLKHNLDKLEVGWSGFNEYGPGDVKGMEIYVAA